MRILVGTVEISGLLLDYADGFRESGHEVTTVISGQNPLYPSNHYDVDISQSLSWPEWIANSWLPLIRYPKAAINLIAQGPRLLELIAAHDIFVFLWGGISLTPGNYEFPLLKRLGKRIVSIFLGSDVRHYPSFIKQYKDSSLSLEFMNGLQDKVVEPLRPLRALRLGEKFSDLILSAPNASNLAIRPYMHVFIPMKLARYQCSIPGREVPVVVHAPSSHAFKGTDRILQTLDQLKNEGVRFELQVLHGVPNEKVIAALAEADVVVDQLYSGGYGKLGAETMASGCALATRAYDVFWPYSPDQPIWHIESVNLYPQLKRLFTDRSLRVELAKKGRAYIERYHDHVEVTRRVLELLGQERIEEYDYYPTYFARHFRLDDGEVIPARLKRITADIVQRWGLPEGVDPRDMIARGLMSADGLDLSRPIPRWKVDRPLDQCAT